MMLAMMMMAMTMMALMMMAMMTMIPDIMPMLLSGFVDAPMFPDRTFGPGFSLCWAAEP